MQAYVSVSAACCRLLDMTAASCCSTMRLSWHLPKLDALKDGRGQVVKDLHIEGRVQGGFVLAVRLHRQAQVLCQGIDVLLHVVLHGQHGDVVPCSSRPTVSPAGLLCLAPEHGRGQIGVSGEERGPATGSMHQMLLWATKCCCQPDSRTEPE